ncbi:hypothetical protein AALP_AAs41607U000300 [Arabis alpina]|uniref:Uncharacterized protein n=1 Tax=Arabis alpina TaxID=50452 RepID=A0A087G1R6_ARAAL|nr:hypothetical protein AALP_AAs41607U000300 [Arabis alpina]
MISSRIMELPLSNGYGPSSEPPQKQSAVSTRSMVKFKNGYTVETVLDGSKLEIEPYSLEVLPNGEWLILDFENSNIYKISSSLSLYSRPRLVNGSPEGYPDTNNAIRKINEGGVTTIVGGKMVCGGGHVDGPSEDAKK